MSQNALDKIFGEKNWVIVVVLKLSSHVPTAERKGINIRQILISVMLVEITTNYDHLLTSEIDIMKREISSEMNQHFNKLFLINSSRIDNDNYKYM